MIRDVHQNLCFFVVFFNSPIYDEHSHNSLAGLDNQLGSEKKKKKAALRLESVVKLLLRDFKRSTEKKLRVLVQGAGSKGAFLWGTSCFLLSSSIRLILL